MIRHRIVTETIRPGDTLPNSLPEWEDMVIKGAILFRVQRYYGNKNRDGQDFATMHEAVTTAHAQDHNVYRVLLYAIDDQDRSVCIPEPDWNRHLLARGETT